MLRDLRTHATPWLAAVALFAVGCSGGDVPGTDAGTDDVAQDDATGTTDAADAIDQDVPPPSLLRFGIVGDIRPPTQDATTQYPTSVVNSVMTGIEQQGVSFVVATGDYMFASNATIANAQVDLLLASEAMFHGHVYHSLGNHECTGSTTTNCPNGTESGNIQVFRSRLAEGNSVYFDWTVPTPTGDAHFIATAPNAWSTSQRAWLDRVLAQPAQYTFVIAHEPPTTTGPSGSTEIESMISARPGGVTLRLYGHTHQYRRIDTNAVIVGNAGAPLFGSGSTYGFAVVEQGDDGNITLTAYEVGNPPMVSGSFRVGPDGTQR